MSVQRDIHRRNIVKMLASHKLPLITLPWLRCHGKDLCRLSLTDLATCYILYIFTKWIAV